MGFKKFFGISNFVGAKRALAELESEKQEMEHAIENNHRDADVCKKRLVEIEQELPEVRAKVEKED
jgi:DNA gyrase/topoisomerase IV subunit A